MDRCDDYKQYIYHMCEDKIKGYIYIFFCFLHMWLVHYVLYVPIIYSYFYTR